MPERFINVTEWESAKALEAVIANPAWLATAQRFVDDPDLHITARPVERWSLNGYA